MDAEILENLTFVDLQVGDSVLGWSYSTPVISYSVGRYLLSRVTADRTYHGPDEHCSKELTFCDNGQGLKYIVSRPIATPPRVPCTRCGKLLHPALSAQAGVTHGC